MAGAGWRFPLQGKCRYGPQESPKKPRTFVARYRDGIDIEGIWRGGVGDAMAGRYAVVKRRSVDRVAWMGREGVSGWSRLIFHHRGTEGTEIGFSPQGHGGHEGAGCGQGSMGWWWRAVWVVAFGFLPQRHRGTEIGFSPQRHGGHEGAGCGVIERRSVERVAWEGWVGSVYTDVHCLQSTVNN